jgi:septal ring factor EnvC (AmiA/AmiB activator)
VRYKPSLVADVFWRPFDSRFASLLERMQFHREIFEFQMQLEEAKHLEQQHEKQSQVSTEHSSILSQVQQELQELRDANMQLEEKISDQLQAFEDTIRSLRDQFPTKQEIETKEAEMIGMFLVAYWN